MKIMKMTLSNFKKISNLTIDFNGNDALISGPNGVGKTTIFDAFNWLISGKDSNNKTENNFGIKTLVNGEVQHNLVHSVEAVVRFGSKTATLRREFKEVWKKKRGTTVSTFSGHTTDYFIDEVPLKEKEYTAQVEKLIACDFQMYSNPMFFSEKLSEKERRAMLIDAFGDVEDPDVIAKNKKLNPLVELLETKTIDMIKDMVKGKMKKANEALKEIPARIDELNHAINNVLNPTESIEELQTASKDLEGQKADHLTNIAKIKADAGKSSFDDAIAAKRREIEGLKSTWSIDKRETLADVDEKIRLAQKAYNDAYDVSEKADRAMHEKSQVIEETKKSIADLREQFKAKRSEQYVEPDIMTVCPTCGQDMPADGVLEAKAKALESFNQQKAEKLETMNATGKALNITLQDLEAEYTELTKKSTTAQTAYEEAQKVLDSAKADKAALEFPETWTKQAEELQNLLKQRTGEMTVDVSALCEADNKAIQAIDDQLSTNGTKIAAIRQNEANKKRIDKLTTQEEAAQKSYEDNEVLLMLCESFTSIKMSMLGEKINSEFEFASFKLFDVQVNGGIRECCVVTGEDGVAWDEAMNTGQKINVGLDVIKTFSRVNGVELPLWIDNAESVTRIQSLDNQVIRLMHRPEENELNITVNA